MPHKGAEWISSEPMTVNQNKFQSHLIRLDSKEEIEEKLHELIDNNKKIKKASHKHILAYSIPSLGVVGYNDDGEAGAGESLLKILRQHRPDSGNLLAVTRWNNKGIKLRQ